MSRPSRHVTQGMSNALNRIYFHAMGLTREDIDGPLVGVATAWDGSAPAGELPLRAAAAAEEGVWAGGATPRQFATVADGGRHARELGAGLLTREMVADSVELTVRGHSYDALVGVAAGPLAMAGLMLAMCRLDVPALLVPIVGGALEVDPDAAALGHAAEELGLALPGATRAGATLAGALGAATGAGRSLCDLLEEQRTPRAGIDAGILLAAATSVRPCLALHLAALAVECGVSITLGDLVRAGDAGRWVTGTLAPDGALRSGPADAGGDARVFDDEAAACAWLDAEGWPAGTALVVRHQGPAGGPAMPALTELGDAVARTGAPAGALLVTDGRLPELPGVTCVSAAGPEAALGGPLACLRDGDAVRLADGRLDAAVGDRPPSAPPPDGVSPALSRYRATVRPAFVGAATHPGAAGETVRYADL